MAESYLTHIYFPLTKGRKVWQAYTTDRHFYASLLKNYDSNIRWITFCSVISDEKQASPDDLHKNTLPWDFLYTTRLDALLQNKTAIKYAVLK